MKRTMKNYVKKKEVNDKDELQIKIKIVVDYVKRNIFVLCQKSRI